MADSDYTAKPTHKRFKSGSVLKVEAVLVKVIKLSWRTLFAVGICNIRFAKSMDRGVMQSLIEEAHHQIMR